MSSLLLIAGYAYYARNGVQKAKTDAFQHRSSLSPVAGAGLGEVKKTLGADVKQVINDSGRNIQVGTNCNFRITIVLGRAAMFDDTASIKRFMPVMEVERHDSSDLRSIRS